MTLFHSSNSSSLDHKSKSSHKTSSSSNSSSQSKNSAPSSTNDGGNSLSARASSTKAPSSPVLVQNLCSMPLHDALYLLYGYKPDAEPFILRIHDSNGFNTLWNYFVGCNVKPKGPHVESIFDNILHEAFDATREIYSIPFDKLPFRLREMEMLQESAQQARAIPSTPVSHHRGVPVPSSPAAASSSSSSTTVTLNKFQYWMFCFAYFPLSVSRFSFSGKKNVVSSKSSFSQKAFMFSTTKSGSHHHIDNAYIELLKNYLDMFWNRLSTESDITLKREGFLSILIDYWLDVWTIQQDYNSPPTDIMSPSRRNPASQLGGLGTTIGAPEVSSTSASRSLPERKVKFSPEFLEKAWNVIKCLQILVTFFLSDPKLKSRVNDAQSTLTAQQRKSSSGLSSPRHSHTSPIEDVLTPDLLRLQIPLFHFLHNCLRAWPRSSRASFPLYHLLELLIPYLAPWRLFKGSGPSEWVPYIRANWCFYSVIFIDALQAIGSIHEDQGISYWRKACDLVAIFADSEVLSVLKEVDASFADPRKRNDSVTIRAYPDVSAHIIMVLDDLSAYTPIFSGQNMSLVRKVINKHVGMANKLALSDQEKQPSNPLDKLTQAISSKFFAVKTTKKEHPEMRVHELLALKLGTIFDTGIDIPNLLFSRKDFSSLSTTQIAKSLAVEPPEVNENGELTEEGKRQLIMGARKCSKFDAHFIGDPMYAPATSFEIPVLIDFWIGVSVLLNQYFGYKEDAKRINLRFMADWRACAVLLVLGLIAFLLFVIFMLIVKLFL
mmetsp:Transcript_3353/g.12742  ORF Transcript_3353/g.12742 Transcript_3353/m.12742 type:complete len:776 (-) Transcript_3353:781-3108(-)|eukprot:CAMPEP_0117444654 /NCGR_PEP_ID=MMETSP0759-20121206/5357_1 /TAXON_ID=63605 /ORGANISM="Percolomonas cosmopolitus, Strain WS" /LENGTH=775 /DNA_ID=CAMNT_0005236737 /DNA_START=127 /DNA_END=2454 /DNA_ORIENTATION=+